MHMERPSHVGQQIQLEMSPEQGPESSHGTGKLYDRMHNICRMYVVTGLCTPLAFLVVATFPAS